MDLWKSLTGMVEVEVTSAEPENTLAAANMAKIQIYQVFQKTELTYRFLVRRTDLSQLETLLRRRGDTLRIVRKRGVFWDLKHLLHRPVVLAGLLFFLISALYLPSRIFFVKIEGNKIIPSKQILAAAEACGIRFGASREKVRSEKVKNALLSAVPQLQWAGVNTSGCVAIVSVRERNEENTETEEKIVSSIIADRDGYILSGTVTRGSALFQPGETVQKGQILISGYTDCGICIQATRAEGEILAQTNRKLVAITPAQYANREEIRETKRRCSLIIGKKRINLWKDSRISDTDCGRMYDEYFVTLPGGFQLPIALCVEKYIYYETQTVEIPESEARTGLEEFASTYLSSQMVAGQIAQKQEIIHPDDCVYVLEGNYTCIEMIGKEQREQIGDINGKND